MSVDMRKLKFEKILKIAAIISGCISYSEEEKEMLQDFGGK